MSHLRLVPALHRFEEYDGVPPGAPGAHCRHCGGEVDGHPARVCGCYGCDVDATSLTRWPGRLWPLPTCAHHTSTAMHIAEAVEANASFEPLQLAVTAYTRLHARGDA
jgi:hypothetical protein